MAQFVAFEKEIEVNGQTILSIKKGLGQFAKTADEIFEAHGLGSIEPEGWYSQQKWLDCFKQIAAKMGEKTLFQIGTKIPESAIFPPEIKDAHGALSAIDIAYHMNHRLKGKVLFDPTIGKISEGIGHYNYKKVDDKSGQISCPNPYPCAFDKGIIQAMARRFAPNAIVEHDNGDCRNKSNETCNYTIKW